MTRIIMTGCNGKMGKTISEIVAEDEEAVIVAGVDISEGTRDYPVYKKISDVKEEADVVIDFSTPKLLDEILSFAIEKQIPTVLCTTGYSAEQIEQINQTANQTALLRSANMSLGINIMIKVWKQSQKHWQTRALILKL